RPDIDQVYMTALNVMGNQGGWPLSMFMTAEGKPILGGTYWPREDREVDGEKIRGFKTILTLTDQAWQKQKDEVTEHANEMAKRTSRELAGLRLAPLFEITRKEVSEAIESVSGMFDKQHGGFGSPERDFRGTKFPLPAKLLLLEE